MATKASRRTHRKRITLDLEGGILSAVDATAASVRESRNHFIVAAIQSRLDEVRNHRIDEAFAAMADDPEYQRELLAVEAQLSPASDELWGRLDKWEIAGEHKTKAGPEHRRKKHGTR
jgi:hypothetical protein